MKTKVIYSLYTDGGARGNPGPAGIGAVLFDAKGKEVGTVSKAIGIGTNNQAEYQAIIAGLELAKNHGAEELCCYLDSELVVKQLNREYRVKDKELASLFVKAWNKMQEFRKVEFKHVPRERNQRADELVNKALDGIVE